MLEITVKTLDSQSRNFSVPDDMTVQAFKQHIAESVNISAERQRLIYQGRVLQDNTQLNANGEISGKVIHLVERLPTPHTPTPAELARAGPRVRGPAPTSTSAPPPSQSANILGPFPVPTPGPNFNSGQFVQQMLQQALGGMASPLGPTVVRGSVRHPNAPGDSRTEIQIHISPQNASGQHGLQTSHVTGSGNQQRLPPRTNQQASMHRSGAPPQNYQPPRPQQVISEPRRQLNHVEYLLNRLEEHIVSLETGNFPQSQGDTPSTSTTTPAEPMETQNQSSTSAAASNTGMSENDPSDSRGESSSRPDVFRHPKLPDVGRAMKRLTSLETRFLPFLIEYTNFLETDPAYSSTESPEYKRIMSFVTAVLKTQRALSVIHRILSLMVIPLSETPPRSMLIQGECQRHRVPPHGRRVHNVATAGQYLNQPRMNQHQQPRQAGVIRMPMFFGPFRGGAPVNMRPGMMGPMPQAMFRFGPPPPNAVPPRPHQSGLYGHPTPSQASPSVSATTHSGHQQEPAIVRTQPVTSGTVPVSAISPSVAASNNSAPSITTAPVESRRTATSSSGTTRVEIAPTDYAVQVTTHIQPNININITPGTLAGSPAIEGQVEGFVETMVVEGGETDGDQINDEQTDGTEMFGFSGSIQADDQGNVTMPMEMQLPNIPGLSQEAMRQIIQSVQGSVEQVMNVVSQNNGTMTGEPTIHQNTERVSVEGLPGGPNQIPAEIANIIGQTVQNVMLNHLGNTDTSQENSADSEAPAIFTTATSVSSETTSSATTTNQGSGVTTSSEQSSTTTEQSSTTTEQSHTGTENRLAGLIAQITEGHFGAQASTSSTSPASSSQPTTSGATGGFVEGRGGRKKVKFPKIKRTPNCVNDIVRGQGYTSEMTPTGDENIISLLLFFSGELFTIPDCIAFITGGYEPAMRLRGPLRQAFAECWFEGSVPTRDQIEAEVDRHSEEARPTVEALFQNERPKIADVSVVESNLSLYRYVIRRILHLLYIQDAQNFARDILNHLLDSFALALRLNIHILRGTEESVQQMIMSQFGAVLDPFTRGGSGNQRDPMAAQMQAMLGGQLIPFTRNRPISQDQIDQFVMNIPTEPEPEPAQEASCSTSTGSTRENANNEPDKDHKQVVSDSVTPMPTECDDKMNKEAQDVEMKDDDSARDSDENATGGSADPDWTTMVPEGWVSVINDDIEKQKNIQEQPPYSEAYMAGMPANKRRKV